MNYGLKYFFEFSSFSNGKKSHKTKVEILGREFNGVAKELTPTDRPLVYSRRQNRGRFSPIHGSIITMEFYSLENFQFQDLFNNDERAHQVRVWKDYKGSWVLDWIGYGLPDLYREEYKSAPYLVTFQASDGLAGLFNCELEFNLSELNPNVLGAVILKDVLVKVLSTLNNGLNIKIAINKYAQGMSNGIGDCPLSQLRINQKILFKEVRGKVVPKSAGEILEVICLAFGSFIRIEKGAIWLIRVAELNLSRVYYREFNLNGQKVKNGFFEPTKSFQEVKVSDSNIEIDYPINKVVAIQKYGDLIIEEGNFVTNGDFQNWQYIDQKIRPGRFINWNSYDYNLIDWNYFEGLNFTNVRRVIEQETGNGIFIPWNNYVFIQGTKSDSSKLGYIESKPMHIKADSSGVLSISISMMSRPTGVSTFSGATAYHVISVRCGNKWLAYAENYVNGQSFGIVSRRGLWASGEYEGPKYIWVNTPNSIRYPIESVDSWHTVKIEDLPIPENGEISVRLFQSLQTSFLNTIQHQSCFNDVKVQLTKNPGLLHKEKVIEGRTIGTKTVEDIEVTSLFGDTETIYSEGALLNLSGELTSNWTNRGENISRSFIESLAIDYLINYNKQRIRLEGQFFGDIPLWSVLTDSINLPGRKFMFISGGYDDRRDIHTGVELLEIGNEQDNNIQFDSYVIEDKGRTGLTGSGASGRPSTGEKPFNVFGRNNHLVKISNGDLEESIIKQEGDYIVIDGFIKAKNFIVNGLGGASSPGTGEPVSGSQILWVNIIEKPETATRWPSWSEVSNKPNVSLVGHSHTWNDILDKPNVSIVGHTHTWSEITNKPNVSLVGHSHSWTEITNKPNVSLVGHNHAWSEITNTPETARRWPTWVEVTDKPSTFSPSVHEHSVNDITSGVFSYNRLPITANEVSNWNLAFSWGDYRHFGLGINTSNLTSVLLSNLSHTQFYSFSAIAPEDAPVATQSSGIHLHNPWGRVQITIPINGVDAGEMFVRSSSFASGTSFSPWRRVWHSGNLRSNLDNDARYLLKAGDTINNTLTISNGATWTTAGWRRYLWISRSDAGAIQFGNGTNNFGLGQTGDSLYLWYSNGGTSTSSINYVTRFTSTGVLIGGAGLPAKTLDVNGELRVNGQVGLFRGFHGAYSDGITGLANWASPIWSMGPNLNGTGLGTDFRVSSTQFGLVWVREGHVSNVTDLGEGLYLYRSSNLPYAVLGRLGTRFYTPLTAVNFVSSSDLRLKTGIKDLNKVMDPISVVFKITGRKYLKSGRLELGFIAQEVKQNVPEVISEDSQGYLSMSYQSMIPILWEAFKKEKVNKDLELKQLKTKVENLEKELQKLKSKRWEE